MDSRARRNLGQLNNELQDVQKIMVQNIDDVLQRGLAISGTWLKCHCYKWPILTWNVSFYSELDNKASNLSALSQKYKKDARYLNLRATYAKIAFGGVIALVIFLYFWVL